MNPFMAFLLDEERKGKSFIDQVWRKKGKTPYSTFTQQGHLTNHIKSVPEGVKYNCSK